jgi:probable F420-dependent oxidoreductase
MRLGAFIPPWGPTATPEQFERTAAAIEALGYDSLWVGDHVVFPRSVASRYPYSESSRFPFDPDQPLYEPFTLLAYLAGRTDSIVLGLSVLVVPLRNPVVTAKMCAGLHALSGGRLVVGIGAGWMKEEFEALRARFGARGEMTDEWIDIIRHLCGEETPKAYEGRHYSFEELGFVPRPRPALPIVVGGNSRVALRRAARRGDGWHALRMPAEELAARVDFLEDLLAREGRSGDGFKVYYRGPEALSDPDSLERYRNAKVDEFLVEVPDADTDERLERFAQVIEQAPGRSSKR